MPKTKTLEELVRRAVAEIERAERAADDAREALYDIESHVAGVNAHHYNASERLVNTAMSALEESKSWVKEIE
jgi:predicted  nucleic acid-binding Zn-ribbon protein